MLKPERALKGDFIYYEGDVAQALYFLIKGEVACSVEVSGEWVEYAYIEEGCHFGEVEIIFEYVEEEIRPREETVRACFTTELLSLDKEDFGKCFDQFEENFIEMYDFAD